MGILTAALDPDTEDSQLGDTAVLELSSAELEERSIILQCITKS